MILYYFPKYNAKPTALITIQKIISSINQQPYLLINLSTIQEVRNKPIQKNTTNRFYCLKLEISNYNIYIII